jgi:hypothetical protein
MGRAMALLNGDMERRAVDQLAPSAGMRLLAIGFGSGVGVTYALRRVPDAFVAGAGGFDAAVTVNNIQCWQLPDDLRSVRRVLVAGGRLSVAVHASMLVSRLAASSPDHARERLAAIVTAGGFAITQSNLTRARSGPAAYITATAV